MAGAAERRGRVGRARTAPGGGQYGQRVGASCRGRWEVPMALLARREAIAAVCLMGWEDALRCCVVVADVLRSSFNRKPQVRPAKARLFPMASERNFFGDRLSMRQQVEAATQLHRKCLE